jgi:hypothetical protein
MNKVACLWDRPFKTQKWLLNRTYFINSFQTIDRYLDWLDRVEPLKYWFLYYSLYLIDFDLLFVLLWQSAFCGRISDVDSFLTVLIFKFSL